MNARAFVLDKEDYDKKLAEAANIFVDKNTKKPLPYVEVGKKLYTTMGCPSATRSTAARERADLEGALQVRRRVLQVRRARLHAQGGDDDAKWDAYLRESILHPEAKIVQGSRTHAVPRKSDV